MFKILQNIKYSEITPKRAFLNRRRFLASAGTIGIGLPFIHMNKAYGTTIDYIKTSYHPNIEVTDKDNVTQYNNFYEFGTSKTDPVDYAGQLSIDPWAVQVDGLVDRPGSYHLDELLAGIPLEERIYRFRCVEAWSMVVPWIGVPLWAVLKKLMPQDSAQYVAFETLNRPSEMPGIRNNKLFPWPYVEGLRLDEALHPLTFIATGMYGESLPKQNGAPLRLVVPWKYGFKSIKSIVKITLAKKQPATTWNMLAPREYGFYSNVNPNVDHPRWSQRRERIIGGGLFSKRDTPMFNGYGEDVAYLYDGMDLVKYY